MRKENFLLAVDTILPLITVDTVVVGTGAASLNAAILLKKRDADVLVVSEKIGFGTSANTGSDKQTYYKLAITSNDTDNILDMAHSLYDGGAMHGDIALIESALSSQAFYNLVSLGVNFPKNKFGEFVGYKTDHDPKSRATSIGPKTSIKMVEVMLKEAKRLGIDFLDDTDVISIITDNDRAIGLICIDKTKIANKNYGLFIIRAENIIYGTGGPAAIYADSVYPHSQTGSTGIALAAGVGAQNLTEWQYGVASTKFRWNLSGSYQQVLPTYFSVSHDGGDKDYFLNRCFSSKNELYSAIFLKGYQWPFDPKKTSCGGSSIIDLAIYHEQMALGKDVYIDFTENPTFKDEAFCLDDLPPLVLEYWNNSGAIAEKPFERLKLMNAKSIEVYAENGIDLTNEPVAISICAQHNNGGLIGDIWWQSPTLKNFFPIGEVNGTHGVYRPGGSALNSGQCGGFRVAEYILKQGGGVRNLSENIDAVKEQVLSELEFIEKLTKNSSNRKVVAKRKEYQRKMSDCAGFVRKYEEISAFIEYIQEELRDFAKNNAVVLPNDIIHAFKNRDILITQLVYLSAMKKYVELGGVSRGSFLLDTNTKSVDDPLKDKILECKYDKKTSSVSFNIVQCREIPKTENWFEKVWNENVWSNF